MSANSSDYLKHMMGYLSTPNRLGSLMLVSDDTPPHYVAAASTQELETLVVDSVEAGFYIRYATERHAAGDPRLPPTSPGMSSPTTQVGRAHSRRGGGADPPRVRGREAGQLELRWLADERRARVCRRQVSLLELRCGPGSALQRMQARLLL
jgi:hypothetical protein